MQDQSFGDCNIPCHKSIEGFAHRLHRAPYSGRSGSGSGRYLKICLMLMDRQAEMSVVNASERVDFSNLCTQYVCIYVCMFLFFYVCNMELHKKHDVIGY